MSVPAYRTGRRNLRRTLASVACCASLAAGCGLTETEPRAVGDAPEALLTVTTAATIPVISATDLPLYFVQGETNLLVRVDRPGDANPILQEVAQAVMGQPTPEELQLHPGISSRYPPGLEPSTSRPTEDGLLTVTVSGVEMSEASVSNPAQIRAAYSQIVCTMTALQSPEITRVLLQDDNGPIRAQDADLQVIDRPLGPADVNDCLTAEELAEAEAAEAEADGSTTTTDG